MSSPEMVVACAREVTRKRAAMIRALGGVKDNIGVEAVAFGAALDQLDSVVAEYEATLAAPTTGKQREARDA